MTNEEFDKHLDAFIAEQERCTVSWEAMKIPSHSEIISAIKVAEAKGVDVYVQLATVVFGVEVDAVTEKQKKIAQGCAFSVMLGNR